jgi:hypothetical protein
MEKFQALMQYANVEVSSYSGRNMYGEDCCAIYCDSLSHTLARMVQVIDNSVDASVVAEALENMQTDSFGKNGTVIYFPNIKYSKPSNAT